MRSRRAAIIGASLLLVSSCASGDDTSSDPASSGVEADADDSGRASTTTLAREEPSAARIGDVIPYLEDLLVRYDEAVNAIVADPSIAADGASPEVEEFLGLFEPGSEFAEGSLEGWTAQADEGIALRPVSADRDVNTTSLEGPPTRIDDDTVLFGQCTVQSYVVVEDGEETRREDRRLLAGTGRAVRAGGHWVLQEITTPPDARGCISQGGVGGPG